MRKVLVAGVLLATLFLIFSGFINYAVAKSHCTPAPCPAGKVCIQNPLCFNTIEDLIVAITKFLQKIAMVITAIVIVSAGYFFVFSQGDPAKVTQARNMVIYALVGLAIILLAQGIIAVIGRVIKG